MPRVASFLLATLVPWAQLAAAWTAFEHWLPRLFVVLSVVNLAWSKTPAWFRTWIDVRMPWLGNGMRAQLALFADVVKFRAALAKALRNQPWRDYEPVAPRLCDARAHDRAAVLERLDDTPARGAPPGATHGAPRPPARRP